MAILKKEDVGEEITSRCTKCKKDTEHVIESKVGKKIGKVRCRVCESTHNYRKAGSTTSASGRKRSKMTAEETWNHRMRTASSAKKVVYTLSGVYKLNDVIDHSHFGLGSVTQILPEDKIQVIFKEGEKILIMGMHPSGKASSEPARG